MTTNTIKAKDWTPQDPTGKRIGVKSRPFLWLGTTNTAATYAMTTSDNDGNALRFELRPGDGTTSDVSSGKDRVEIATTARFAEGVPLHISYKLKIDAGSDAESWWGTAIGQIHQDGALNSPPFAIMLMPSNHLQVNLFDGTTQNNTVFFTITRGTEYAIDIFFLGGASGRCMIFVDGVQKFDFSGTCGQATGGLYWKEGLYRLASTPTTVATFTNLQIEAGDLVTIGDVDTGTLSTVTVTDQTHISAHAMPAGVNAYLHDGAVEIGGPNAVSAPYYSAAWVKTFAAGLHYLRSKYDNGKSSEEGILAICTGATYGVSGSVYDQLDNLNFASGLGKIYISDGTAVDIPAITDFATFIPKYQAAINAILGTFEFKKIVAGAVPPRTDYYDKTGVLTRTTHP
jgi:Polysaccharide lyase